MKEKEFAGIGKYVLLSEDELKLIIKALKYDREENNAPVEYLENDLKMVLQGIL